MLLAAVCIAIAVAAVGAVLLPLLRRAPVQPDTGQFERAVYRDQIAELEQEVARDLVPADAAASARLQIERRLLAASPATVAAAPIPRRSLRVAAAICVVLLLVPAALYLRIGSPRLPDQPYAARATAGSVAAAAPSGHDDVEKSIGELAAKLQKDPDNAEQWLLYARTAATLGKWDKSVEGYRQVLRLASGEPDVLAGYGEMQVMAEQGIVTPGAREAFNGALAKDPRNSVARFYLALADAQAGELPQAIDAWVKLAADTPDDADMREEIARRVAEASKLAGVAAPALPAGPPSAPAPAASGGPDASSMAAAADMAPEQRDAMIAGMVKQLAERLDKEPNDADGWLKLGRAYLVLKQPAKAAEAYDRATQLRPADANIKLLAAMASIDALDKGAKVPDRAVQWLQQAQAADPAKPEVYWYLGIAAAHRGNPAEALQQWRHLLAMLPADDEDRRVVQDAIDSVK